MTNVIEIPEDELSFEYWSGTEAAVDSIGSHSPDIVFVCGEEALNHTFRIKGIKRMSGQIKEWNGVMTVLLLSPGYITSHPSELAPYAEAIQKAYMIASGEKFNEPENEFEIIHTFKELLPYLPYLSNASWVSFDFETTTLTDMATFDPNFRLRGLALTYQIGSAIFLDLENMSADDLRHVAMALDEKVFGNPDIVKIGHNVKFDMHCAVVMGIKRFEGAFHCTMLMSQLLDENTPNGLKYQVSVYFPAFAGYENKLQGTSWESIPVERLAPYAALDSDLTLRLYLLFTNIMLEEHPRIYNLFRNLTAPATKALFQAEQNGMLIDKNYIDQAILQTEADIIAQEYKLRKNKTVKKYQAHKDIVFKNSMIAKLEDKILREGEREFAETPADRRDKRVINIQEEIIHEEDAGRVSILMLRIAKEKAKVYGGIAEAASVKRIQTMKLQIDAWKTGSVSSSDLLNFGSPAQMNELIYSDEGFNFDYPEDPITGELKSGTGKDVLNYIADRSGFLDNLLAYRQLTKILSTYLISIRDKVGKDGRIHTSFNQHIAKTGRLSSSKPNLQNQITRTKYEIVEKAVGRVKGSFSVPFGHTLLQADYSQAELRLIAHYSQDKQMMQTYLDDQDLHELTAANVKGLSLSKWKELDDKEKKESRFEAKSENFGLCLSEETAVITDRGTILIKEVVVGDKVLTHKGNWQEVTDTQCLTADTLYNINTRSGKNIKCTGDHMMYVCFPSANGLKVKYGWVRAEDMELGMYLVNNHYEGYHGDSNFGEDLSLFIGWYLSEGGSQGNNGKISQIEKSNPDVYKRMRKILCPKYSYRIAKYAHNVEYFAISSDIMRNVLGKYIDYRLKAEDKTFSHLIPALSREDKRYILAGLWDGDGSISMRGKAKLTIQYTSISKDLLSDIQECLYSFGIPSKIYGYDDYMYSLNIIGSVGRSLFLDLIPTVKANRVEYRSSRQYFAEELITSINTFKHADKVYDLTVDQDNSFIANNLVSHNCYGMSAGGYRDYARVQYGIIMGKRKAEQRRDDFFKLYPGLKEYHKTYIAKAYKFGHVRTMFGRKVRLPDLKNFNRFKVGHAERNAINSPIQGTAGEMTIFAFTLLQPLLELLLDERVIFINTIHDSILYYVPDDILEETILLIKTVMENLPIETYFDRTLSLPMKVDFERSKESWGKLAA